MKSTAATPREYVAALPPDRRAHVETLRKLVKKQVPAAAESIQWGMIGYALDGRPFAAIASQKNYLSLYLMDLYTQPGLRERHAAALAKLKMGKSCINFSDVEELPLDAIADILRAAPAATVEKGTLKAQKTSARRQKVQSATGDATFRRGRR
jgi:uncharacterized protein YdhG (YjbR/CyaY superfamily)